MPKIRRRTSGDPVFPLADKGSSSGQTDFTLAHVTAVGAAREIIRSGQIEKRKCKIFTKELTYFFALRPAYRRKDGSEPSDQLDRFPFVFLLRSETLGTPYHVYPFDTGGAMAGAFDEQASDYIFLEDYRLLPNYEAVARHIDWAFETRSKYYQGELRVNLEDTLPFHEACARSFLRIAALASVGSNQPDKRASAIELAYDKHVPIKGNVKFVILPRQFLEDPRGNNHSMLSALDAANIEWDVYDWQPNRAPDEFREEITGLAREYLELKGQL